MNAPQLAAPAAPEALGVPFVRLDSADAELSAEIFAAIERVAATAAFTLGEELEAFEQQFAAWCETDHAIGVSSGTSALELALRGLGIGPGDEVVLPTNSFIATAEAVTAAGATPVLVDVDEDTALLTAEIVEAALTERTRCVIPVHLYGRTVEMEPILALCRARGLRVIEDACQAHGARYRGQRAGTFGDAGCFSFYPTKNLGGWGDGGAVVTADPELAARIQLMRSHGEGTRHHHEMPSGTHRLHSLQAAILGVKLTRLDGWNENRRRAAAVLGEALADSGLTLPAPVAAGSDHVFHLFVARTPDRDALRDHLGRHGVASAIHYPTPIHLQPAYAGAAPGPGDLPVTERLAAESCSLPIFPSITDEEITRIAEAVASFSS
ncbi:MAG TPA: DegT/DnrJ/EryC1/StrS family aminotransferase [Solirubrobacterales bacterium]|nr:DegT/DnrJ/EryC1/StrS family aminotransferase [Solirubrobacterales bacterium]